MLKINKTVYGNKKFKKETTYSPDDVKGVSAEKKQAIVDLISEGSQLTLLATIINQIVDHIGLDSPEIQAGKDFLTEVNNILKG